MYKRGCEDATCVFRAGRKRGLSGIIAMVILVLIAIAAVVIVWLFISPSFDREVDVGTFEVNVEIVPGSVVFSENNDTVNLTVRRNPGDSVDFQGFSIVIWDVGGHSMVEVFEGGVYALDEFGTVHLSIPISNLGVIDRIEIFPLVLNSAGDIVQISQTVGSDEYELPATPPIDPPGDPGDDEGPTPPGDDYSILLLQMTDTHIITNGDCNTGGYFGYGNTPNDGRTCCPSPILAWVDGCEDISPKDNFPDNWDTCPWFNRTINETSGLNWIAVPTAPSIVTPKAVAKANNEYDADYVFISGDLVAVRSDGGEDCGIDHNDSMNLFASMMNELEAPYFPIGAEHHDHVTATWPGCADNYLNAFEGGWAGDTNPELNVQGDSLNWYFVDRDNLFIGLSETEADNNHYDDEVFLTNVLDMYKDQNMKVFITLHVPWECWDEHITWSAGGCDGCTRCDPIPARIPLLYQAQYRDAYRVFVLLMGHTHANQWVQADYDGPGGETDIYHVITTSIMTYPSEFRVIEITNHTINMTMSSTIDPAIDAVSLEMLADYNLSVVPAWPPETLYGEDFERDIFIDLGIEVTPITSCGFSGWEAGGYYELTEDVYGDIGDNVPCLTITADDVTLNCFGYYVYNTQEDGNGPAVSIQADRVTLKDCALYGSEESGGSGEGLIIGGNDNLIDCENAPSDYSGIPGCGDINGNGAAGVHLLSGTSGNVITNCGILGTPPVNDEGSNSVESCP